MKCIHFYEFEGDLSTTHFLHLSRGQNKKEPKNIQFTQYEKLKHSAQEMKEERKMKSMTTTATRTRTNKK